MKVILVSAGNFQDYLIDNIKNLILHGNNDITLITESSYFYMLKDYSTVTLVDCQSLLSNELLNYNSNSRLDRGFRNGFWYFCSLRFFFLYEYIKRNNLTNVVHLENDVMVYINLDELQDKFTENKVYATFDSPRRVIPGFLFIPNYLSFKPIIDNYNQSLNDMENLAYLSNYIEPLPIFINGTYSNKFNTFNCIFDAAAIGQYLGGVDKKNDPNDTRGFINETCIVNYGYYKFEWIKENNLWCPYVLIGDNRVKIINLHIHCKELFKFMSNDPKELKLIEKQL